MASPLALQRQTSNDTVHSTIGFLLADLHQAPNAAVSGRPKGESVLTAWFIARAERGRQAVAAYRRILPRAQRGEECPRSAAGAKPPQNSARTSD